MQVTGPGAGEPVLVSRKWLTDTLKTSTTQVAPCHPVTGALLDHLPPKARRTTERTATGPSGAGPRRPGGRSGSDGGRVRRRRLHPEHGDGEKDPVARPPLPVPRLQHRRRVLRPRPRPTLAGRTHPRRQPAHRVPTPPPRQTTTRLDHHPDPGRGRHLDRPHRTSPHQPPRRRPDHACPDRARRRHADAPSTSRSRTLIPDGPHSELEYRLEHHTAPPTGQRPSPSPDLARPPRPPHRIDLLPATATIAVDRDAWPRCPAHPRTQRSHDDDQPAVLNGRPRLGCGPGRGAVRQPDSPHQRLSAARGAGCCASGSAGARAPRGRRGENGHDRGLRRRRQGVESGRRLRAAPHAPVRGKPV